MPTKITKEQARENRLDVLEGRAYVAELIEKKIPTLKWVNCGYHVFKTRVGPFDLFIYHSDSASLFKRGFFGGRILYVSLTEGSYEKVVSKAPYTKAVADVIEALEEL